MLVILIISLFYFIIATPDSAQWLISLAFFIAIDVFNIVPLLAVVLWLWGPRDRVCSQRQLIVNIG
ncbi:phosphatase PAP2 family protein, partial [Salmonella enterica subsp. enterica serovar Enteritidis]